MPKRGLSEFVSGLGSPAQQTSNSQHEVQGLVKTTYYLRPIQAKALKMHALMEGRTVSEMAREAVDRYLAELSEGAPQ